MLKLKLFANEPAEKLESKINQWLADNPWVIVKNITQSSGSTVCISIWYEEPNVPILG